MLTLTTPMLPCLCQAPLAVYMMDERINLLMEWVQAVCLGSGVLVQNFTSSFADGRVLCLLVSARSFTCVSLTALTAAADPANPCQYC